MTFLEFRLYFSLGISFE